MRGSVRKAPGCGIDYSVLLNGSVVEAIPYALKTGESQTITVQFKPSQVGTQKCMLVVGP